MFQEMYWYVVILGLMLFPLTFAYVGYVIKIDTRKLVLPMATLMLLFFMACRGPSVGADTLQYINGFRQICSLEFSKLFRTDIRGVGGGYYLNFEYGYRLFNKFVSLFSEDGQAIVIGTSVLIIALLSRLVRKYSIFPILSIWLYITLGIFQTQMNMSRNGIAILICYLGFPCIQERNLRKYLLYVAVGSLFHLSSILFLPFYWIAGRIELTPKLTRRLLITAIALGFGFTIIRPYAVLYLPFGFGRYFAKDTTKIEGLAVGIFYFFVMIVTWLMMDKSERLEATESETIGSWMFIANVFFFSVGYVVSAGTRMAALFGPYLMILVPNLLGKGIKNDDKRLFAIILIMGITGAQYILRLMVNNIGATMPYVFFWA